MARIRATIDVEVLEAGEQVGDAVADLLLFLESAASEVGVVKATTWEIVTVSGDEPDTVERAAVVGVDQPVSNLTTPVSSLLEAARLLGENERNEQ